jgi:hypothetical protein
MKMAEINDADLIKVRLQWADGSIQRLDYEVDGSTSKPFEQDDAGKPHRFEASGIDADGYRIFKESY